MYPSFSLSLYFSLSIYIYIYICISVSRSRRQGPDSRGPGGACGGVVVITITNYYY